MCHIRFQAPLRLLAGFTIALSVSSSAAAQNANQIIGGLIQTVIIEAAKADWRKVRATELACIEEQLQQQGTSTANLAQQGIFPIDARVAGFRAFCNRAATPAIMPPPPTPVAPINQPTVPTNPQPLSA